MPLDVPKQPDVPKQLDVRTQLDVPEPLDLRMQLDVLAIAAHPDDAEISAGGILLRLAAAGKRVGILDLTRGELGTRGDAATRAREVAAADRVLGTVWRGNLDLGDGRVADTHEARAAVAAVLRELRPAVVLAQHFEDLHPDHAAAGKLARAAWYLAGLRKLAEMVGTHAAFRPPRLYHFMGHVPFEPSLVADVTSVWERKVELIRCYASQLAPMDASDRGAHLLFGADVLARAETKARYFGERIGARYGEPLLHVGPLPAFEAPL
jgi:bacillithiol biosynthesis deacetylase BshB1